MMRAADNARAETVVVAYDDVTKPAQPSQLFRDDSGALWMLTGVRWGTHDDPATRIAFVRVVESVGK